ncbi:MAG TPA: histidinol-phosphate transaminase [Anaerolineae bacterium]|nr:histidinol-phosphate transaminase [Anaerolineae bacterium]
MNNLLRRGLEGLVPYEPGRPISLVEKELGIKEAIKLASNESPYRPFSKVVKAMQDAVPDVNRYPDGGSTFLREGIAAKLNVPTSRIIIGSGSNELLRLIANVLLNPEDEAVMATPSFIVYPTVVKLMNAKPVEVPLKDHRHDLEAMANAITERTKLVFICNPNNPTGTIVNRNELEKFLADISDRVVVVLDEAYFELVRDAGYPNSLDYVNGSKPMITLRTFSKVHGLAGLRIGYGVAPESIVQAINKVREPFNVNTIAQVGALSSLDCDEEIEERSRFNYEGLQYLYGEFKRLALDYIPSHANFVLVNVKADGRQISNDLMKKGVIVRSGDIFGYPRHIRVSIGTPDENSKFINELENLLENKEKGNTMVMDTITD